MKKQLRGFCVLLVFASSCFVPSCKSEDWVALGIVGLLLGGAAYVSQVSPGSNNDDIYNADNDNNNNYYGGNTTCTSCNGVGKRMEGMDSSGQPAYLNCTACGGDGKI